MADLKYQKYVRRDAVKENKWGGDGISLSQVQPEIIPADVKLSLGVTQVRKSYMFHSPIHKHDYTEFFFFFGSNPQDMHEFDAEVEFSFGEEAEKHIITSPTVVIVPPDVYHCPLNFAKVFKPIYCLEAFLTAKYSSTNLTESTLAPPPANTNGTKYDKYFIRDAVKENRFGGEVIGLGGIPDDAFPPQSKMNLGVSVVRKPYMFHEQTHKHTFTEFFMFFGSNPQDMHEFDAEAEFHYGEEKEKYVITSPTILTVPADVYHCPLNFARVWQPIYCVEAFMTEKWASTNL